MSFFSRQPGAVKVGPLDADQGIRVSGVQKVFGSGDKAVTALSEVDLTVSPGEIVTLFGPSGCGKSTLLRIMAGLDQPSAGEIEVLGSDPREASRRKNIAWIPQSSALLPWSDVNRNVRLSEYVNRRADQNSRTSRNPKDAAAMLAQVGLADFTGSRPSGLSGGMRQRASIARGFTQGAPLMLMDEPFSALDELTKHTLQQLLLDIWTQHRTTIVFVTHSVAEAVLLSDRVVVMTPRPGRIHGVVEIDLPRQNRVALSDTPDFARHCTAVKDVLRQGWQGE